MWKMKIIKIVELKQLYNKRMPKLEVPKFERKKSLCSGNRILFHKKNAFMKN